MRISDWPEAERPREKLLSQGSDALSDAELLAIFLRTGVTNMSAVELGRAMLIHFGSLQGIFNADLETFCTMKGLGVAKYAQLQATLAMAKRHYRLQLENRDSFESAEQTKQFLVSELQGEPHEVFAVMMLNSQHQLIAFRKMFYGTIDSASVHPRVIVKQALSDNAAAVILTHNHPSGVAEPSLPDKHITLKIQQALALIDIRVLDHLVIGGGEVVSFAERGLLN